MGCSHACTDRRWISLPSNSRPLTVTLVWSVCTVLKLQINNCWYLAATVVVGCSTEHRHAHSYACKHSCNDQHVCSSALWPRTPCPMQLRLAGRLPDLMARRVFSQVFTVYLLSSSSFSGCTAVLFSLGFAEFYSVFYAMKLSHF